MKKILIATWCNNNGKTNYGQVLQAFALQKYLSNKGYEVKIINYTNTIQVEKKSSRVRKFKKFVRDNIKFTKLYKNINELNDELPDTDILLAGSDQIWNPANLNEIYFLNFGSASIRKISYASSGIFYEGPENSEAINKIVEMLRDFHAVSVRERISASILGSHLDNKPEVVCDPVFLLNGNEWLNVSKPVKTGGKYILCYIFGSIRNKQAILDQYRKVFSVEKILVITSNLYEEKISWDKIKYIDNAGVSEFIYLIKNAEAVVTDSFHGTSLSIIFKKQFINIYRYNENSNPYATGERIKSLMESVGMEFRKVGNVVELEKIGRIDYGSVYESLNDFKERSEEYLLNAIS